MDALLSGWSLDGLPGLVLTVLTACAGVAYLVAAELGRRHDRRGRRWPARYSGCWLAGLAVLLIDLDSAIGAGADTHLADHMVEHMVIWLVVAPLLVAGAPVRLALFALGGPGRRRLGRWLHARPTSLLTSSMGSVALFSAVILVGQIPAVYALTLRDDPVHVTEHALYLLSAMLVWAPVLGVDPLPHRPGVSELVACLVACMVPMLAVAGWLLTAHAPIYSGYRIALGFDGAMGDQHLAGLIMALGGIPAFGLAALAVRTGGRSVGTGFHRIPAPTRAP